MTWHGMQIQSYHVKLGVLPCYVLIWNKIDTGTNSKTSVVGVRRGGTTRHTGLLRTICIGDDTISRIKDGVSLTYM